jgi:hypothetical protein
VPKCQKSEKVIFDNSGILTWPTEGNGSPDSLAAEWTEGVSLLAAIARPVCIRADRRRHTVLV